MDLEQLSGRYRRLKDELSAVYDQQPWPTGRIDRLAHEMAEAEQAIAALSVKTSTGGGGGRRATRTMPVARNRLPASPQSVGEPAAK